MSLTSSQVANQERAISELAERYLTEHTSWSAAQRDSAAKVAALLLKKIPASGFFLVGLSGAPGCGKSALARLMQSLLNTEVFQALVISLDDYYQDKRQRQLLANKHPLFNQRGVPGTHDWEMLLKDLDCLESGLIEKLVMPRFDKILDDRVGYRKSQGLDAAPRVVILEGWLIGAPPQAVTDLKHYVNQLESSQDANSQWRTAVNQRLAQYHRDLKKRLDSCWFMSVPGWDQVIDWRWQQEQQNMLSGQEGFLQSREAVERFLDQFQRIALHMKASSRDWADVIIDIDPHHHLSIAWD